jgi:hypothetical protein
MKIFSPASLSFGEGMRVRPLLKNHLSETLRKIK